MSPLANTHLRGGWRCCHARGAGLDAGLDADADSNAGVCLCRCRCLCSTQLGRQDHAGWRVPPLLAGCFSCIVGALQRAVCRSAIRVVEDGGAHLARLLVGRLGNVGRQVSEVGVSPERPFKVFNLFATTVRRLALCLRHYSYFIDVDAKMCSSSG